MNRRRCAERGLTLLEVVVSIGIIVLMVATLFGFYERVVAERQSGRTMLERGELAWVLAHRIADEIRSANGFLPGIGPGIRGLSHEITLQTLALPDKMLFVPRSIREKQLPAQSDVREVRYYVAIDAETLEDYPDPEGGQSIVAGPKTLGIVRRELKTLRQTGPAVGRPEEVDIEILSDKVRYLRFRYFDGVDWVDVWQPPQGGLGNSLPQAVEVTVGYTAVLPEDPGTLDLDALDSQQSLPEPFALDRYTVVVRLNQADTFFGSRLMRAGRKAFGSGGSGSGGSDSGGGFGSN